MIPFAPGQIWRYKTRDVEPFSTLVICYIEPHPQLGRTIHISLNNLRIRNPKHPNQFSEVLAHTPIAEGALRASVTQLVQQNAPLPDWQDGYRTWQANNGGVFTLPVSEIVNVVEGSLNPIP
jgi:hypothetical protein